MEDVRQCKVQLTVEMSDKLQPKLIRVEEPIPLPLFANTTCYILRYDSIQLHYVVWYVSIILERVIAFTWSRKHMDIFCNVNWKSTSEP